MSYNGWKNKETWLVNLWMGDYLAEVQADGAKITPAFIQETVEEWCRELQGNSVESGFIVDLFNCALGDIDYQELSEHFKD